MLDRHVAFIEEYLANGMVATHAYRKVYPNVTPESARRLASVLLSKPAIRDEINRRLTDKHMGADEVLSRLAEQARCEYSQYFTPDGKVDIQKLIDDGKTHLIKGIRPTRHGKEIQFHDGQTALLNIGKQHGLFSDRHILENKMGQEIERILDILQETLNPDDYQNVLRRLSDSEKSERKTEDGSAIENSTA